MLELKKECGKDGIRLYPILLAHLAEVYEGNPNQDLTIIKSSLIQHSTMIERRLNECLTKMQRIFNFRYTESERRLIFNYPKFFEKQQKYFHSGGNFKKLNPTHIDKEVEIEVEEEKEVDTKTIDSKISGVRTKERDIKITSSVKDKKPPSANGQAVHDFIAFWFDLYKKIYNSSYPRIGKHIGICKRLVNDLGLEKVKSLTLAYFNMRNQRFVQNRHDLVTFEYCLPQVQVFMDTGKNVTYQDLKKIEISDSNKRELNELLEKGIGNGQK